MEHNILSHFQYYDILDERMDDLYFYQINAHMDDYIEVLIMSSGVSKEYFRENTQNYYRLWDSYTPIISQLFHNPNIRIFCHCGGKIYLLFLFFNSTNF